MTKDAQFALRRIMEQYSRNARFCLICNYVSKIIPAVQSRCTLSLCSSGRLADAAPAHNVIDAEGVRIDEDGLNAVIRLAKGDMRKVLNVLQSAFMAYDKIGEAEVCKTTGNPLPQDIQRVMHTITNDDIATAFATVSRYS